MSFLLGERPSLRKIWSNFNDTAFRFVAELPAATADEWGLKMRMPNRSLVAVIVGSCVLAACGGGGANSGGQSQTASLGPIRILYAGKPSPKLALTSGNVVVAGQAGAAFSGIDFYPAKDLANTLIAYGDNGEVAIDRNGVSTEITSAARFFAEVSVSSSGKIASDGQSPGDTSRDCIYTVNSDGSDLKALTPASLNAAYPAWSHDGKRIAFIGQGNGGFSLYAMNADGTGITNLTRSVSDAMYSHVAWTADDSRIAFCRASGAISQIYWVNASGGTAVNITPAVYAGTYASSPAFAPDGTTWAYQIRSSDTYRPIVIGDLVSGARSSTTPSGVYDDYPSFSPDGKWLAFLRTTQDSSYQGAAKCQINGENFGWIHQVSDPVHSEVSSVDWGPFQGLQRFVGSGGPLGTSSSGFLFGQNGDLFSSIFSFQATTPSSATITPAASQSGAGALVFNLHADSIKRMTYVNDYYGSPTTISPIGDTDALVSFSSTDGQVTLVAPFAISRDVKSARPTIVGGNLLYAGSFLALYNSKGKNLAPSGASQILIDPKSGGLVSWR